MAAFADIAQPLPKGRANSSLRGTDDYRRHHERRTCAALDERDLHGSDDSLSLKAQDFSLLFAGWTACLFRLPAQKIGNDPINLRRGQQECGHSAVPARFSVWLRQKFAQRRLGDFGPRGDLDESRGRRVEDRRAALICGNDMAAQTSSASLRPAVTVPASCPLAGTIPAKASARACAASNGFLIASSTVNGV